MQIIWITGGSTGIGYSVAKKFLENNWKVIISARDIEKLLVEYKIEPRTGIIGPKLLNTDGSLQLSAGFIPKLSTTIFELWRLDIFLPKNLFGYRYVPNNTVIKKEVGWVTGACFLIKKSLFEAINGFDENFFMYLENNDLCKRVADSEGSVFVVPTSKINHLAAKTVDSSFAEEVEFSRNWHWIWSKFYFNKKHYGLFKAVKEGTLRYFLSILKFLFYFLINDKVKKKIYFIVVNVDENKREVFNKYKLIDSLRKNNKGYYIYSNEKINENSANKKS